MEQTRIIASTMLARYTGEMRNVGFSKEDILYALEVGVTVLKSVDEEKDILSILNEIFGGAPHQKSIFAKGEVCKPGPDGRCLLCGKYNPDEPDPESVI